MEALSATRRQWGGVPDAAAVVGGSRAMAAVRQQIELAARSNAPVLLSGEPGSGRRTAARAIHLHSDRAGQPLVVVPCGARPAPLVGEVLFGATAGPSDTPGVLLEAARGSVLLEHVEQLPADSQQRLLRVLQRGALERAGVAFPVRCRLLAYSEADLVAEVRAGRFDEELCHRLNAVPLHLLPLRRRRGDVPALIEHFLTQWAQGQAAPAPRWPQACTECLLRWSWPGNVAELRRVVEQAARSSLGGVVSIADLPAALRGTATVSEGLAPPPGALEAAVRGEAAAWLAAHPEGGVHRVVVDRVERALLELALERSGGVKLAAARLLGVNRNTLYHKLPLLEEP